MEDFPPKILQGRELQTILENGKAALEDWIKDNPNGSIVFVGNLDGAFSQTLGWPGHAGSWPFADFQFPGGSNHFNEASSTCSFISFSNAKFGHADNSNGAVLFQKPNLESHTIYFGGAEFNSDFAIEGSSTELDLVVDRDTFRGNLTISGEFHNLDLSETKWIGVNRHSHIYNSIQALELTKIAGHTNFTQTSFEDTEGLIKFERCAFEGPVSIGITKGAERVTMLALGGSTFNGQLSVKSDAPFGCVPDLVGTGLSSPLALENLHFQFKRDYSAVIFRLITCKVACDRQDESRLRVLKRIAEANKDYKNFMRLQIQEMQAARFSSTPYWQLPVEYIFFVLSDYGRSLTRPFWWLAFSWLVFASLYVSFGQAQNVPKKLELAGLTLSARQISPFLPSGSDAMTSAKEILYGEHFPEHFFLIAFAQTIFSGILIFLIGLALRNRFRI